MRKLLIVLGAIVGLLLLAAIVLPFIIDAERFRPMAETQAKAALGRDVKIGKLELAIFSGGVKANEITIADDPAFSRNPFLQAKALNIGVEMWPMITRQEAHVTALTVVEPVINLIKAPSGKWNFESLGATKTKANTEKKAPPVSVQHLRVKNGTINVHQGSIKRTYEDVNVSVDNFSNTSEFPFEVSAKTPGGGSLELDGRAGPLAEGNMTATPMNAKVKVKGLDLGTTGFVSPDSGLAGKLDFDGKVDSDGKLLKSEGKATVAGLKAVKGGAPAKTPVTVEYASQLDIEKKRGEITRGDIIAGPTRAKVSGTFDTRGDAINVNARLKGDQLPLDSLAGLLPAFGVILPQGSQVQGGTVSTDLQMQGPADRLVITGPINVANTKVSGFNLKSRASAISSLGGIPSTSDLLIQALNSKMRVAPEGIRADGIQLVVPNVGTVMGDGTIGANNSLNFKMRAKLAGGGGLAGGLSTLSTLGQSKGEIPFLIQGTTSNPIFLPDIAGAIAGTAKAPVQAVEGAGGLFGGLFGKKEKKK